MSGSSEFDFPISPRLSRRSFLGAGLMLPLSGVTHGTAGRVFPLRRESTGPNQPRSAGRRIVSGVSRRAGRNMLSFRRGKRQRRLRRAVHLNSGYSVGMAGDDQLPWLTNRKTRRRPWRMPQLRFCSTKNPRAVFNHWRHGVRVRRPLDGWVCNTPRKVLMN